jgi:hypothetical protein
LGVAGGLGPDSLGSLRQLVENFPMLSIDAETNLRTVDNELDLDKVNRYLIAAHQLLV